VIDEAIARLAEAGCETPRLDAEVLLADSLGVDRLDLYTRNGIEPPAGFAERIERRAAGEPVAYITGRRAFRNLDLAVDPRVLIPRPDSETLVEVALELAPEGARVHDVGTGSGAVALALKDERPDLVVTASDASAEAIEVARANAARLGLDVPFEVVAGLPPGNYDVVVANLPYVREDEWHGLAPDIRLYEPRQALVFGHDGLDLIRELVAATPSGTPVALEHAPDQAAAVRALLDDAFTRRDLAGLDRVTAGVAR
jgi:release factor glutamine methyltransferase